MAWTTLVATLADESRRSGPGRRSSPLVTLMGTQPTIHASTVGVVASTGAARLLAFLALYPGANDRRRVAGRLWPEVGEARAAGNLRTAMWRVNALGLGLLCADRGSLALQEGVLVDVGLLGEWAARMNSGVPRAEDLASLPRTITELELLPGWQDDWLLLERERIRQRLLHALEALVDQLVRARRVAEAVEVALIAVAADALRESAQRALITAHLAEGNVAEARRCFAEHRVLVRSELGVEPSATLTSLLDSPGTRVPAAATVR